MRNRKPKKAALIVLQVLLCLAVLEVGVRLFYHPPKLEPGPSNIPDPAIFAGQSLEIKKPGEIRIVCLGDSQVAGWPRTKKESWPAYLQEELRARDIAATVCNLGWPGSTSYQTLWAYRDYVNKCRPKDDIVIVHTLCNDASFQPVTDAQRRELYRRAIVAKTILHRSALYCLLRDKISHRAEEHDPRSAHRVPPDEWIANLNNLRGEVGAQGAAFFYLELPVVHEEVQKYQEEASLALPTMDISNSITLQKHFDDDEVHFDLEGHRVIAKELARIITGSGLIDGKR